MSADTGVWTYAITEDGCLSGPDGEVDLSWLTGVGEAQVRTATGSGLTVLVSDVSLAEFGEAALRQKLANLDWLDEVAREHHYVIDAAARLFPLLPVRLATVYSGDAALRAALADHNRQLLDTLRRVGGRVEWGVKAYAAPEAEPGNAERGAQAVHAGLTARAIDVRLNPPQSAQLSAVRRPMLRNAAYLLDAADGVSFTAAVAGHATAHPELRIDLTGPWPPYSFVSEDDDRHLPVPGQCSAHSPRAASSARPAASQVTWSPTRPLCRRRSHPVPAASARRSREARRSRAMPATQSAASTWPRSVRTPPGDAAADAGTTILPPVGIDPLWVPSTAAA